MMPRKSRRSSILKPPKQVVRAPTQDLDSDDEGTLTQPTSRRVSFSRTSQIKEFDPSIGYMTKWNQSYEESLESIEGDENQAKSANVFDGLSSVQTQKKFKRKRTSTVQLSLNSSNIETSDGVCSDLNQSLHQSSDARAVKQPRKSLDCFKTEVAEEGDTSMFFDELNLTEPIKSSYSIIDRSTNLTKTLMDSVFDHSDTDICQNKIDLSAGCFSETLSKINCGDVIVDAFSKKDHNTLNTESNQNISSINNDSDMDMTLAAGGIEVSENILNKLAGVPDENMGPDAKKTLILNPMNISREDGAAKINGELSSSAHQPKNAGSPAEMHGEMAAKCESLNSSEDGISMDLTLAARKDEVGESYINIERPGVQHHGSTKKAISNSTLPFGKDDIKRETSCKNSATVMSDNDFDDLLPLQSMNGKDIENSNGNNSLEVSMELTIPQVRIETAFPKTDYQEANIKVCQDVQDDLEIKDLEMTSTWGQIVEKKSSVLPSGSMNECDIIKDKPELPTNLTDGLDANEEDVKEKVANSRVSSDMELSMTNGGIATQESMENRCMNSTQESDFSDEACADMEGMELTVPLGKLKMSKAREELETTDFLKPLEINEVLMNQQSTTVTGKNLEEGLPKEMTEKSCIEDTVNDTNYLESLDETCADINGMEMTVSLGTIKEKIPKPIGENIMENIGGISDFAPEDPLNNELEQDEIMKGNKENLGGSNSECHTEDQTDVPSNGESQVMNKTELVMSKTVPLHQSHEEQYKNPVDNAESCTQLGDETHPEAIGMDGNVLLGRLKENDCDPANSSLICHPKGDDTNPDLMGMELTVPLGKLKGEMYEVSNSAVTESQAVDVTSPESVGMEITFPLQKIRDEYEGAVDNTIAESHVVDRFMNPDASSIEFTVPLVIMRGEKCKDPHDPHTGIQMIDDTNPETIGMEITVPLGGLNGENHEYPVDNTLVESGMMDETFPDAMGMELTVPLGRLKEIKYDNHVDNVLPETQMVNDTNSDAMGMELTVAVGRMKEGKFEDLMVNTVAESQMVDDTNTEIVGVELVQKVSELKEENANLTADVIAESLNVDDINPDGMELTVPLGRLKGVKCEEGHVVDSLAESQMVDGTITEIVGVQSIPMAELKEENANLTVDVIAESQKIDDTNPDGMELTIPLGRLKGVKCEEGHVVDSLAESQMVDGTNTEIVGVQSIPMAELKEENANLTVDVIAESQKIDDTNPDGMELTIPLGKLKGMKCEDLVLESVAESQMVDGDITATAEKEFAIPIADLTGEEGNRTANVIAESKKVVNTNSDGMGMELTVPLGGLKGEYNDAVDSVLLETQMVNGTNTEAMGMEVTGPLGPLKRGEYEDTGRTRASEEEDTQMVDQLNPKAENMELIAPLVTLEYQQSLNYCGVIEEEHKAEFETSIGELDIDKSKVEFKGTVTKTGNKHEQTRQDMGTSSMDSMVRQLFNLSEGQKFGDLIDDNMAKSIFENSISTKGVEMESSIHLNGPDEKDDVDINANDSTACKTGIESNSAAIQLELSIPFKGCDEEMTGDLEGETITHQGEDIIPEPVDMEMSLTEAKVSKLESVDKAKTEFQVIDETSFNECELMETNTPIKKSETPKVKTPVHNTVPLESLDARHTSSAANGVSVECDVNASLRLENDEQQLENSICERKITDCEELASSTVRLPIEREANKENDFTYDRQSQTINVATVAEMDLIEPLGKLKSHKKVSEVTVALSSQLSACVDVKCSAVNSNNDSMSEFALVNSNSIINNEPGSLELKVVPSMDSGFAPTFENEEQPRDDPSLAFVNNLAITSEEVAMDCGTFSDRDECKVDADCVEPMDDTSDQENSETNRIASVCALKVLQQSELDCDSMEGSGDCHMACEPSNVEETSLIADDSSDSSAEDIEVNASIQGENSKPVISIEDWIKEESDKEFIDWRVYKLLENQWSFMVFHEATVLILDLKPLLEDQDSKDNRMVESIVLKSSISDDNDWCIKVVLNVMLKKLSSSLLSSKCSSTEQLPSLFDFLNSEILAMNLLLLQTYGLMKATPAKLKTDGFSFRVTSMKRMLLFEVQINLLNWDKDGVKPEDVKVRNIIGKMGETEIQSIVQSVRCDERYFQNVYKEVINFIFTLEKVLE